MLGLIVILAGIYIYLAMQTGTSAQARPIFEREGSRFLVFAHRGGGGLYPENTLGAFADSAKLGADVLELDVRATSDGKIVVLHDAAVDRTTDGHGKISEMPLAAVKKLDAGYPFTTDGGQTFPFRGKGVVVPTLDEIFTAFPEMTFNIEPKQETPSIIAPLCGLIRQHQNDRKTHRRLIQSKYN